jgi:hypothetical protein
MFEPDEFEQQLALVKYQYGRSLRMIGEDERARDVLRDIDLGILQKEWRQASLLNLALCYQSLREDDLAIDTAKKTISAGRSETYALQAKSILVELDRSDPGRLGKLKALEDKARRKKAHVLANTIALTRANTAGTSEQEAEHIYLTVASEARMAKDFYNGVRAIIRVCKTRLEHGHDLTHAQKTGLIDAYHFLFNERLSTLFDGCHNVLWDDFEKSKDDENLLRLFRHSSLIWRLRGFLTREKDYILRLAERVGTGASGILPGLEREKAYFTGRASAALLEDHRPKE